MYENIFLSRGLKRNYEVDLYSNFQSFEKIEESTPHLINRLKCGNCFNLTKNYDLADVLKSNDAVAPTPLEPYQHTITSGKNTYTYDAHTYHTKVPPQGITKLIDYYLPQNGLVLDPFAGSGMTGVASLISNRDVILNELSPSACFIADRFTSKCEPQILNQAVDDLLHSLSELRNKLYFTTCRECGRSTEILFTVWSYKVKCYSCDHEFLLWDYAKKYGANVREHKILSEFECPNCKTNLKKSKLKRTYSEPVFIGYKCCSNKIVEHPLEDKDIELIKYIDNSSDFFIEGYYPQNEIPVGVNLNQPRNHGLNTVDSFYSKRNLIALNNLWYKINYYKDSNVASFLGFIFTSLYQRVTKLSEYRFWGGSGNTARFNVPFIFNEANVFITYKRKANSILDHLHTTAQYYKNKSLVVCNTATKMNYLPNESIDFIFTDPPFGSNINYSEMNFLWESWLNEFTNTHEEAIINKYQHKSIKEYENLMLSAFNECYRVLRDKHWMLVVFMNSSSKVWDTIINSLRLSKFDLLKIDIFDKKHGTFKHFVSKNTTGYDLILHCRKDSELENALIPEIKKHSTDSIIEYMIKVNKVPVHQYKHVNRLAEIDLKLLYSRWLAFALIRNHQVIDFKEFSTYIEKEFL